jgi:hypothetical protein
MFRNEAIFIVPTLRVTAIKLTNCCVVIPAWMPESRHMDVNAWVAIALILSSDVTGKLPSLALDTGILAGMTA